MIDRSRKLSERDELLVIVGRKPRPNRHPRPRDPEPAYPYGRPCTPEEGRARAFKILILMGGMLGILGAWAATR